jgi:CRISPR type III-A-associated protein Csm2
MDNNRDFKGKPFYGNNMAAQLSKLKDDLQPNKGYSQGESSEHRQHPKKKGKSRKYKDMIYFENNILKLDKVEYDTFIDKVKKYASYLQKNNFTTSMIRKIYSRIMRAFEKGEIGEIKRLRLQFAYIAGRNKENYAVREFMDLLDMLAKNSEGKNDINCIKHFVEAIVAYMKYYGDKT